jgi:predicted acyl esterase
VKFKGTEMVAMRDGVELATDINLPEGEGVEADMNRQDAKAPRREKIREMDRLNGSKYQGNEICTAQ